MGDFGGQNAAEFVVGKTSDCIDLLLSVCLPVHS